MIRLPEENILYSHQKWIIKLGYIGYSRGFILAIQEMIWDKVFKNRPSKIFGRQPLHW